MRSLILLVEDHVDSREMLEEFLTLEGFAVEVAGNGLHAWERLRKGPTPDVMLLDLMMPVMSGWELMERVQKEPRLKDLPVIVVSGAGATRPVPQGIRASIPKPLDLDDLMRALEPFRSSAQSQLAAAY
ncbi:response regulator [Corallococcus interemptor]|uniref:response regulator n=1 Tax=Corallococcus TaxID=83461 RepID=UPI001CC19F1B|nr:MULTISPECIES: response regulator [unclassified Corallococcus]MBZ4330891.1 response regulator [Corallococcus sp. AS-1-12]MBZ4376606.1 response regulator [Corallococcus sp. AS-1-6]